MDYQAVKAIQQIEERIYQSLASLKAEFERKYQTSFEVFHLKAIIEGYPTPGYVLNVYAPGINNNVEAEKDFSYGLFLLWQHNPDANRVKTVKFLWN